MGSFDRFRQPEIPAWAGEIFEDGLSWRDTAPRLRVQLHSDQRLEAATFSLARNIADDLWLAVVLDQDTAILSITETMYLAWQQPADVVFERAIANLRAAVPAVLEHDPELPPPLVLSSNDSDYSSAAMYLDLPRIVGSTSHGALVMFPTRFTTAILPIDGQLSVEPVNTMLSGGQGLFIEGEGPLTPNLYWWRAGTLQHIPVITSKHIAAVVWPRELQMLMQTN
ncbi:MAG TPA: hypothetical protein VIV11_25450 [Kofleriaceae bacterium]